MSKIFIIKNQHNHYLGKHDDWVDGSEPAQIFRSPYRDVVLNKLIDANIKDFTLRGEVMTCDIDKYNHPVVEVLNPLPEKEPVLDPSTTSDEEIIVDETEAGD